MEGKAVSFASNKRKGCKTLLFKRYIPFYNAKLFI